MIPAGLPGPADVYILGVRHYFESFANGDWETGSSPVSIDDFGTQGSYAATTSSAVPEPATAWLMVSAAGAVFGLRRLRRQ